MNEIKNNVIDIIQKDLNQIEKGQYENLNIVQQQLGIDKIKKWKKGFICEINLNSINGSVLFGNIGPTIPIKLSFLGYNNVEIETKIKEYGINNTLVTSNIVIKVLLVVTMPITSDKHEIAITYPLTMNMINGEIPNYYFDKTK